MRAELGGKLIEYYTPREHGERSTDPRQECAFVGQREPIVRLFALLTPRRFPHLVNSGRRHDETRTPLATLPLFYGGLLRRAIDMISCRASNATVSITRRFVILTNATRYPKSCTL